jgi:hypothetical protein
LTKSLAIVPANLFHRPVGVNKTGRIFAHHRLPLGLGNGIFAQPKWGQGDNVLGFFSALGPACFNFGGGGAFEEFATGEINHVEVNPLPEIFAVILCPTGDFGDNVAGVVNTDAFKLKNWKMNV